MSVPHELDELTGLHTRGILDDLDRQYLAVSDKKIWSLLIIDIDHFKLINDVYGHLEGDKILRRIANVLAKNSRNIDTLLRYGGDEFVVIMPATQRETAIEQAKQILKSLSEETFPTGMEVGLSIGVAASKPKDIHISDIFERADKALYDAKVKGRGRVSFHEDGKIQISDKEISFNHFIGRDSELAELRNILDETITGKGQTALVSGEHGMGKNRLATELKHYSRFKNCFFLETRCYELGADRPYMQMTGAMGRLLLSFTNKNMESLRKILPAILPQTAELFPSLDLQFSQTPDTDQNGVVRFRMYSEIATILRWIVARKPVVFLVENLQWISEPDYDLLAYLARATPDIPLLFLTTIREPVADFPEIEKKIRILSNLVQFTSIKLEKMDNEQIENMTKLALRDPELPPEVLKRLVDHSGGNPLYLKELLLSLHSSGAIEPKSEGGWTYKITSDLPLPTNVSQMMSLRLEKLDAFAKEILCTGTLMSGGFFSLLPIAAVLRKDELELAKALEEPLRLKLIREELSASNSLQYEFLNGTMRRYLYQELTIGTRKALQARFGQYYESIYDNGDTSIIPRIAHHYCDSLNSAKARHFALMAEAQSNKKDAKREALHWLEKYMSFTGSTGEDPNEAFRARLELGRLYILLGNHDKAADILKESVEYALTEKNKGLVQLAEAYLQYNKGNYADATHLYEAAIERLPMGKDTILASMQIVFIQYLSGSLNKAIKSLKKIFKDIQTVEDPLVKKQLMATYYMRHGTVALEKKSEKCEKAVEIYRELSDKIGEARALLNTASALSDSGKYATRIDILNTAFKVLNQTGDTHAIIGTYINLGQVYFNVLEYSLSRDYFEKALDLVEVTGTKRFAVWAYLYLGNLSTEENDFISAEKMYMKAIDVAEKLGLNRMALTTRLRFVNMLIISKNFLRADRLLSQIEQDKTLDSMGDETVRYLQWLRGIERLQNTTLDQIKILPRVESLLRSATHDIDDNVYLDNINILGSLAEYLYDQNTLDECKEVIERACTMLDTYVADIDNDHYRTAILNSKIPKKISRISELLQKP